MELETACPPMPVCHVFIEMNWQ
uniref:Uncharacterized protein n=1 Tax=Arundo donax TaxID=35708 RepID=A0A0A8ZK09_ARUDO